MGLLRWIGEVRADRKIKRLLRDTPERALTDVRENKFVRVVGIVQPHRARVLEAPLSGRLCAYYSITVQAYVQRGFSRRGGRRTITVADEDEGIPFELEADGQRAIIDPRDAWISSKFDHTSEGVTNDREHALYERLGLHRTADMWRGVLFQEAVLGIGERVAVFGAGIREPDPDAQVQMGVEQGYRDGGAMRLRFTGSERFPLVIRDDLASL
jgi:hypothetical protein